jgi:hypothetical protein
MYVQWAGPGFFDDKKCFNTIQERTTIAVDQLSDGEAPSGALRDPMQIERAHANPTTKHIFRMVLIVHCTHDAMEGNRRMRSVLQTLACFRGTVHSSWPPRPPARTKSIFLC